MQEHSKAGVVGLVARMTEGVSRTQPSCQQASGAPLEDQHGVICVLAVADVEEAELLLTAGRIVGGFEIEQDLDALADLVAAEADELPARVAQAH